MSKIITIPGLIDPHVHLRDPGQTQKEDFYTGSAAALAGGYTTIMDMPNNVEPITTLERLENKLASARDKIVCDVGFHFGSLGDNFQEFPKVKDKVKGLKIYMNITTGNFIIDEAKLIDIYKAWPSNKPILLHAEDDVLHLVLEAVRQTKKQTHVCHVSSQDELEFVIKAKKEGLPVSCGVTPHHLFLTQNDEKELGAYARMKPSLKTQEDQDFLWANMEYIDVIESDHAPHTKAEKDSDNPPFGVPGLETTLPMMLTASSEGRITHEEVIKKLHTNPARIFNVRSDPSTKVEVEITEYKITDKDLKTKAGWSPFSGRKVIGKVQNVYIRGNKVFENGEVIAKPGSGRIIN